MSEITTLLVGGAIATAAGTVGGVVTVAYQFRRQEKSRRGERQIEALLELEELLAPIHVSIARTLPPDGNAYYVPPVMELSDLNTHELNVNQVEGSEKWDELAQDLWELEKVWRSRLRIRILDSTISSEYAELREIGVFIAKKDVATRRASVQRAVRVIASIRSRIGSITRPE